MADAVLPADGVVTGSGTVFGRLVHLASQDFTVAGGSAGEVHNDKVVAMMQASLKTGTPFVFINDSGGARVQEGIDSLSGYGRVFLQQRDAVRAWSRRSRSSLGRARAVRSTRRP